MSKIAEKKAKEIAKKLESSQAYKFDKFSVVCGAIEGYDQAMQDFLEKACEWWENTLEYNPGTQHIIKSFKSYMQDEM